MEKIILVAYVNVGTVLDKQIPSIMEDLGKSLKKEEENILLYLIPTRIESSRIECINPRLVDEFEYKSTKEILDVYKKQLDEFLKK